MKKRTKYFCSKCNVRVIVRDNSIIRPCAHKDATVIADLSATVYGIGAVHTLKAR